MEEPMKRLTWLELASVEEGARVVFAEPWDIFPFAVVPQGTLATVKENSLNEMIPGMWVLPDDENVRQALADEWEGCVHLYNIELKTHADEPDSGWDRPSPLALPD
jgi:hypothetical protein